MTELSLRQTGNIGTSAQSAGLSERFTYAGIQACQAMVVPLALAAAGSLVGAAFTVLGAPDMAHIKLGASFGAMVGAASGMSVALPVLCEAASQLSTRRPYRYSRILGEGRAAVRAYLGLANS